jgi:hypothetical protein
MKSRAVQRYRTCELCLPGGDGPPGRSCVRWVGSVDQGVVQGPAKVVPFSLEKLTFAMDPVAAGFRVAK